MQIYANYFKIMPSVVISPVVGAKRFRHLTWLAQEQNLNVDVDVHAVSSVENDKQARCFLINARSICNKIEKLNFIIYQFNPLFIFITEGRLSDDFNNSLIVSDKNYKIIRNDRNGKRGGGVCALI